MYGVMGTVELHMNINSPKGEKHSLPRLSHKRETREIKLSYVVCISRSTSDLASACKCKLILNTSIAIVFPLMTIYILNENERLANVYEFVNHRNLEARTKYPTTR
uniref:Uncharacterized protein n=1 Tax=Glossina pallidipes TaxID=7398 RepID=A0A1A9ZR43_GLOPL